MARQYSKSNRASGVRLYGFEEYIEKLTQLTNGGVEQVAEKCFDDCCQIIHDELEKKMQESKVPEDLKSKTKKFKVHAGNIYMYSEGWNQQDPETFNKVCYLNYGTPPRYTKKGHHYRGKIEARGFISNAKRAAAQRMKKVQKESLKEVTKGL